MSKPVSMHERLMADEASPPASDRTFGLTLGLLFLGLGAWPLVQGDLPRWWAWALAAWLVSLALLRPQALASFNRAWMQLGRLLGRLTTPIVTAGLFYSTITPIGLIFRLTGRDALRLRRDPGVASYWIERRPLTASSEALRKPY